MSDTKTLQGKFSHKGVEFTFEIAGSISAVFWNKGSYVAAGDVSSFTVHGDTPDIDTLEIYTFIIKSVELLKNKG